MPAAIEAREVSTRKLSPGLPRARLCACAEPSLPILSAPLAMPLARPFSALPWPRTTALLASLLIAGLALRSGPVSSPAAAGSGPEPSWPPQAGAVAAQKLPPAPTGARAALAAAPSAPLLANQRFPHYGQRLELNGVPLEGLDPSALNGGDTQALYKQVQHTWLELNQQLRASIDPTRQEGLDLESARELIDSGACAYVVRVPRAAGGSAYVPVYSNPDPRVLELRALAQTLAQSAGMQDHARRRVFESQAATLGLAEQDLHVRTLANGIDLGIHRPDGSQVASYHQRLPGDP
jgi:hypothetical protein